MKHTYITDEAQTCNSFRFKLPNQECVEKKHSSISDNCHGIPALSSLLKQSSLHILKSLLALQHTVLKSFLVGCFPAIEQIHSCLRLVRNKSVTSGRCDMWQSWDKETGTQNCTLYHSTGQYRSFSRVVKHKSDCALCHC